MNTTSITMTLAKSTKNTHVYNQNVEPGKDPAIPSLYIQKTAFTGEPPKVIDIVITPR